MSLVLVDFRGLMRSLGQYARAPASCVRLWNMRVQQQGSLRKRTGDFRGSTPNGGPVQAMFNSRLLDTQVLLHRGVGAGTVLSTRTELTAPVNVLAVDSADVTRPIGLRMQAAVMQRNHYLTSDEGPRRLESNLATPLRYAGMPPGLQPDTWNMDGTYTILVPLAGGALPSASSRAYRVTWHRQDLDGVEMGGPPTGRVRIANVATTPGWVAATAANVQLRVRIPLEWGTAATALASAAGYFCRLWATRSSTTADGVSEEYFLVDQRAPTAADITNGYVVMLDTFTDALLPGQERLHTNSEAVPAAEAGSPVTGPANADDAPPLGNAIAAWRNCVWLGDVTYRPTVQVELLALGGAGLALGDTVTVGTEVYTAAAARAGTNFVLGATVEETARNLVEVINANSALVRAFHVSTARQRPGLILFEWLRFQGGAVGVALSKTTAWFPQQAFVSAPQEVWPNGLVASKQGRGDAFPEWAFFEVGPRVGRILRLVPHQDVLLVFTDSGLYRVTGNSPATFDVSPQDNTFTLLSRDLVAESDGSVYAWCREGILEVRGLSQRIISEPIEDDLRDVVRTAGAALPRWGWAVGYRQAHEVRFYYPQADAPDCLGCAFYFAYDTRMGAWSQGGPAGTQDAARPVPPSGWREHRSCGVVRWSDDLLITSNANPTGADSYVWREKTPWEASPYVSTLTDGGSDNVQAEVWWQWQTAKDALGAVQWLEAVLQVDDGSEYSWRPLPALPVLIEYASESLQSGYLSVTPSFGTVRHPVPPAARHARRVQMRILSNQAEYLGIVMAGLRTGEASAFPRGPG